MTPSPPAGAVTPLRARILIAEDEGVLAEELRDRLESMGHEVIDVVGSGADAVTRTMRTTPDLVIMDIRLGGDVDGIEAAQQIGERSATPLIYLTAHSDDSTLRRAKRTNPLGYLIKPVRERDLRATVEMALHQVDLERRLRESEARYETTLNSIGDAVIATDADGRVTFLNPVAAALTGWPRGDAIGQPLDRVFRLRDAGTGAPRACPVRQALDENRIVYLPEQTLLVARDGSEIPVGDSAAPIRDALQVRGAVMVFRDLREAQRVAEVSRKNEDEARQVQKMEAIGRLAGGLAHDVNNMMTVVIGFGELALEQLPVGHPVREMVAEMKRAGDRAAALTRQLLAFSRKQVVVPSALNLNEVVTGMEGMLRRLIGPAVDLRVRLQPNAGWVMADRGQVEQVVMNLAINARDAMPRGGALVVDTATVELGAGFGGEKEVRAGSYVQLSVSDTGHGMDAVTRDRVFEPFFTTKEMGRGTGLGLATVYGIVKQARGQIIVESELGRGSTFRVYLPLTGTGSGAAPVPLSDEIRGGSETILLVDDDEAVRRMTRELLRQAGYRVLEAADGEEALALCARETGPIHLLLTDAIMPVLSGRAVAERVVKIRPGVRVLFVSGYTEDHVLQHDASVGEVPFVQKPFGTRELVARVRQVLDGAVTG